MSPKGTALKILLVLCCLLGPGRAFCQQEDGRAQVRTNDEDFRLVKDSEGIQVYNKESPKKGYIEYKATTVINEPDMENVLDFFMDYANHSEWVYNCLQSKMWQKNGQTYLYQTFKSQWPFKNRDVNLLVKKQHIDRNTVTIDFTSEPDAVPDHKKNIRIHDFESKWLVRQSKNKVWISVYSSFDPKLKMGGFMLRSYATKIPFEMLKKLKILY